MAETTVITSADELTEIIPFTQAEIEQEVKTILLSKGLTDIQYPGSNVSQMADIMTYLVHVLNTNTAINLQETILPLASKRTNILFGARQLGYEPVQNTSYRYNVRAQVLRNADVDTDDTYFTITIPKYTKFVSGDKEYIYMGVDVKITTTNNEIDVVADSSYVDIEIKQGTLIEAKDNELLQIRAYGIYDDNDIFQVKQDYLIPFKNIEDDGIELFLTYIDGNGTRFKRQAWTRSTQFIVDSTYEFTTQKFTRLQNIFLQMPTIWFEIGGYGNAVRLNTLIEANIIITEGADGEAPEGFTANETTMAQKIDVTTNYIAHYGTNAESTDSIKENASIFNNSANRVVTALDYISLSQRHPSVKYAKCWGSEDETEQDVAVNQANVPGIVYLSYTPEITSRVFESHVLDNDISDSDPTNDDVVSIQNEQYDLLDMPRYPYLGTSQGDHNPTGTEYPDTTGAYAKDYWVIDTAHTFVATVSVAIVSALTIATVTHTGHDYKTGDNVTISGATETEYNGSYDITVTGVDTYTYDMGQSASASPATGAPVVDTSGSLSGESVVIGDIIQWDGTAGNTTNGNGFTIDNTTVLDANEQLDNWYLNYDLKIDYQANPPTNPGDATLFTYLLPYKIMTIRNVYRQPTYLDFNFVIKIIKYDLSVPRSVTNSTTFDVIDNYFNNYMERFDSEFFVSNLQSRIDEGLSENSGVELDFTTQLTIHENMYDNLLKEIRFNNLIIIKLAFPFDPIYNDATRELIQSDSTNGTVNFLPTIDTVGFAGTGMNLSCDVDVGRSTTVAITFVTTTATVTHVNHMYATGYNVTIAGASEPEYNGSFDITVVDEDTYTYTMTSTPAGNSSATVGYIPGFKIDRAIAFPIWLGDGSRDGSADKRVGYYFVRNEHIQDIEIHLYFDDTGSPPPLGSISYGLGVVPISDPAEEYPETGVNDLDGSVIPADTFTDSGYGYIDLKYPGLSSTQGENIPVTENTMPRLRQVKFIS